MIIFAIVGKSAAGKDTLSNSVSNILNLKKVISYTTRPKRKNEKDGVDYYFISNKEMQDYISKNETANHTSYNVVENEIWHYAYLKKDIEVNNNCIMILNPMGLKDIKNAYKNNNEVKIITILIDAPLETRISRSLKRNGTEEQTIVEIIRRAIADETDFNNFIPDYTIDTSINGAKMKLIEIMQQEMKKNIK